MSERLTPNLIALLGEEGLIKLAEAFGGTRLYVPLEIPPHHEIVKAIGAEAAQRLSRRYAPAQLRIPLARELRARHYRETLSLSNAKIAVRLGIGETGVDKLFARMDDKPAKGGAQLALKL